MSQVLWKCLLLLALILVVSQPAVAQNNTTHAKATDGTTSGTGSGDGSGSTTPLPDVCSNTTYSCQNSTTKDRCQSWDSCYRSSSDKCKATSNCAGKGTCTFVTNYNGAAEGPDVDYLAYCLCPAKKYWDFDCSNSSAVGYINITYNINGPADDYGIKCQDSARYALAKYFSTRAPEAVVIPSTKFVLADRSSFNVTYQVYTLAVETAVSLANAKNGSKYQLQQVIESSFKNCSTAYSTGPLRFSIISQTPEQLDPEEDDWWDKEVSVPGSDTSVPVIVIGVVVGFVGLVVLCLLCWWKKRKRGITFSKLSDAGQSQAELELYRHYRYDF
eukprot:TRINITY_DN8659_c0_g1::TRINITY_DN8659_c0_g1_i1::g.354::m.354 TRINITY_DN8659_c0_g1::TRINITY_DN8659_c0_g1_i1::g.354  ORF type:complete len:330 (-),score=42.62,DUF4448/PF14610.1/0.003,BatA/PF07584.6/4e+02,BatA/PF07584.6/23,BatA/PF07584.6/6.4,SKG6/PF08693.5/9.9e+03,SKG6/PF08693.5/0.013,Adeno_E3_CR2/PF02439.10/0.23 TRINITY_DN8659_c0_g1_i1:282-1271(-)